MDISKLFRKPIKDTTWVDMQHVAYVVSPDKKYKIAFSHFQEIRMSTYEGLFTLLDGNDTIIEKFEPLTAISNGLCCWTSDSNYFAVAVGHSPSGYLIVRLPEIDFAFIKMVNPYLDISFNGDKFLVGYSEEQVALTNSTQTFGGGVLEIPTKTMIKPCDLTFDLSALTFYSRQRLNDFAKIIKSGKEYNLQLIDGGYNEFKGVFPQDTKQIYNTRQLEIYQLEAFAEYGDQISKEWLEMIKQKTGNNYNRWTKVSDYIGFLKR
ncbi:MAG: hypothetical protein M3040_17775 [Bacteroidota bacterium]|nr:hypothetical protein [Bacteroidota bacterium]